MFYVAVSSRVHIVHNYIIEKDRFWIEKVLPLRWLPPCCLVVKEWAKPTNSVEEMLNQGGFCPYY